MTNPVLNPPSATRQVSFHELLLAARQTWTIDALSEVLGQIDPKLLKSQLLIYAPVDTQKILAAQGIRDEHVFPTPIILETKPTLVGYYRLLIGVGQKSFYRGGTGMGPFQRMENEGILTPSTKKIIPAFCVAMSRVLADLIRAIASTLTSRDIHELQLLTLGSNFYGSANNTIGQAATRGVLEAIAAALKGYVTNQTARSLTIAISNRRTFLVTLASDPDVSVQETTGGKLKNLLSIEIKGGSDAANVYNRGGEAEKSHQGAKQKGYAECWTVIRTTGIDIHKLQRGSPSTAAWFDTSQILAQTGKDWNEFSRRILNILGINPGN